MKHIHYVDQSDTNVILNTLIDNKQQYDLLSITKKNPNIDFNYIKESLAVSINIIF